MFKTIAAKLKRRKRIFLLFILSVFSTIIHAQSRISGTITDAVSKKPVAGATVSVKGSTTRTISDESGRFTLKSATIAVIRVTAIGYKELETTAGADLSNLQLTPVSQDLE